MYSTHTKIQNNRTNILGEKHMLEILLLLIIFSLDTLLVSMSYSINKITLSFKSCLIIASICSLSLLFALLISNTFKNFFNPDLGNIISFIILGLLGIYNLVQEKVKAIISKYKNKIVNIYLDQTNADLDNSKNLNCKEAILLSIILSLDSLVGGISIGFMKYNIFLILLESIIINISFINIGSIIGKKLNTIINFNTSYITGIILILLAILKII